MNRHKQSYLSYLLLTIYSLRRYPVYLQQGTHFAHIKAT